MIFIIVRMRAYDDAPEDGPMTFVEVRKIADVTKLEFAIQDFRVTYLGLQNNTLQGVRTVVKIKQTVYQLNIDGTLTYLDHFIDLLPPPIKVKVINNTKKPQTTWFTGLEATTIAADLEF